MNELMYASGHEAPWAVSADPWAAAIEARSAASAHVPRSAAARAASGLSDSRIIIMIRHFLCSLDSSSVSPSVVVGGGGDDKLVCVSSEELLARIFLKLRLLRRLV